MQLRKKDDDKAPTEQMDWHQAQAALATGNYDIVSEGPESEGDRGPKFVPDLGDEVSGSQVVRVDPASKAPVAPPVRTLKSDS